MKTRTGQKLKLTTVEELLGVPATESSKEIDVDMIHMFKNHPFKVLDDEKMSDLVESIRVNGILSPVLVRPDGEDSYEMISGHRRMHAAKIVGLTMIPAIVREMSDDEAMSQQSNADTISEVQNLNFKKSKIRTSKSPKNQLKLYPLSRTFLNLSTLIFRRDFSGVSHLTDLLFLQIQQSGQIGYRYP